MNEIPSASATAEPTAPVTPVTAEREESLRKITLFDYALHIASPVISMMSLTLVALIINYVKRVVPTD